MCVGDERKADESRRFAVKLDSVQTSVQARLTSDRAQRESRRAVEEAAPLSRVSSGKQNSEAFVKSCSARTLQCDGIITIVGICKRADEGIERG